MKKIIILHHERVGEASTTSALYREESSGSRNEVRNLTDARETYLEKYGCHFNEKLADYAVARMKNIDGSDHRFTSSQLLETLRRRNLTVPKHFYDFCYEANKLYSDFYPEDIRTEADVIHAALRYMTDPDGYEGMFLARWLVDERSMNRPVRWEDFL